MTPTEQLLEKYLADEITLEEMISGDIPQNLVPEIPVPGAKKMPYANKAPFGPVDSQEHLNQTLDKFLNS
jgi:hypothetical protein